jgi:hypothetical protein
VIDRSILSRYLWSLVTVALLPIACNVHPLLAQADRAARARAAYRRAIEADRSHLVDSSWRDLQRAARLWPVQPAYQEAVARTAARRGDQPALVGALAALTRMQSGERLVHDSVIARLSIDHPAVATARDRLITALRDIPASRVIATTTDSLLFLEGIAVGPRSGELYLTSLRQRAVIRVAATGQWITVALSPSDVSGVFGIVIEPDERSAWITTGAFPPGSTDTTVHRRAELINLSLPDGAIRRRWTLGDGTGTPGEIARGPDGTIVVSDGAQAALYRLSPGADSLHTVRHPLLRSPQGIVVAADGRTAWIADWSTGLLHWRFTDDRIVRRDEPDGASLVGLDGLTRQSSDLIGIQNGLTPSRVVRIHLDAAAERITRVSTIDRQRYEGDVTVGVTRAHCYLFVSSAPWPFFDDDGKRRNSAPLPGGVVRALSLDGRNVERCGERRH